MCFGGFDAPSEGEQEMFNDHFAQRGVPMLGNVPISREGHVGPVAITTSGFARGNDGSIQHQETDYGFSLRGAAETVGFIASGGSTAAFALAAGRGAEAAHGYLSGRGLSPGGGPVAAPETGGLPSPPDAPSVTPAIDKRYLTGLPAPETAPGGVEVAYLLPWPSPATNAEAADGRTEEQARARLFDQGDATLAAHTADHEKRLHQVLRRSSNPTGPMGLRVRPSAQQPRLLGE